MSAPSPLVVYTAIAGGYDVLLPPRAREPGARYVAFADRRPRFSLGWEVRPLPDETRAMAPRTAARWCKINVHRLLPEAAVSVWLDGNIRQIGPLAPLIDEMHAAGAALATFRHPERDDVRDEAAACARLKKFDAADAARIEAQLARYAALPRGHGLFETGVMLRDRSRPGLDAAMDLWWAELEAGAKRDQISLPWVLRRSALPVLAWEWSYRDPNPHFHMPGGHRPAAGLLSDLARLVEARREDGPARRALADALDLWRRVKRLARPRRRGAPGG